MGKVVIQPQRGHHPQKGEKMELKKTQKRKKKRGV